MNKTVFQIASEIGVSKQAVWQKIKKEPLSTDLKKFTEKIGNTLYVNTKGVDLIKSSFFKINANQTSIDINKHQENIKQMSIKNFDIVNESSININNQQKNIKQASTNAQKNINDMSIDVNDDKDDVKQMSIDKIVDALMMQLKTVNKQNENLAEELSKEREHSRELADKLAEIASNAQKLHAGDIVTPRLNTNDVEVNSTEKLKKRNGIFNWILKKSKDKM